MADRVVLVLNNPELNILILAKISATHQTSEVSKTDLVHGGKEIVVQHAPHSSPHVHLSIMFEMLGLEEYLFEETHGGEPAHEHGGHGEAPADVELGAALGEAAAELVQGVGHQEPGVTHQQGVHRHVGVLAA